MRAMFQEPLMSETASSTALCPIVLACDANFAMPLATMIVSLAEAHRDMPLELWLLTKGFSQELRDKVEAPVRDGKVRFHWETVDLSKFTGFSRLPHVSEMTYARFLIPYILPAQVTRVLYLDVDTLVLSDLAPLMQVDLGGAVIGAVSDGLNHSPDASAFAGVPEVRHYFNAGMLLIDVARWRESGVSEKALEYLIAHPETPFADQDALNVVCDGCWKELEPTWNFQQHHAQAFSGMPPAARPAVVHFVTSSKPWNLQAVSINAGFYNEFRDRTRFARTARQAVSDLCKRNWYRITNFIQRHAR